jgi:hypothetical protein
MMEQTASRKLLRAGIAGLLGLLAVGVMAEGLFSPPLPKAKATAGEQKCVEPVDVMRRDHMNFILHQRDATMYQGMRAKQHSLVECINCHVTPGADGKPVSIHSKEHFCSSCHEYAAVKIDCFECHASQPSPAANAQPASVAQPPAPTGQGGSHP